MWVKVINGFNATTAFLLRVDDHPVMDLKDLGFNATTAFLLQPESSPSGGSTPEFQCHHGVPASGGDIQDRLQHPGFNATTAFLLH